MTAPRRTLPINQAKAILAMLREEGFAVTNYGVDIGPDYLRLIPPANSNAGDSLGDYINRTPHRSKTEKGR